MEPTNRPTKSDLATDYQERLAEEPWAFDFFQAVRRLEAMHEDRPRVGTARDVSEEFVRFGQQPSLAFESSSIARFDPETADEAARMLVRFFGLLGPNGPLPLHLTELVVEWGHGRSERLARINRDAGTNHAVERGLATNEARSLERERLARFFDVFHHRAISLFYRAWAHHEQAVSFDRGDDPFGRYVGSLAGLAGGGSGAPDTVPREAKLHYAGHLANPRAHPEGLASILEDFFDVAVEIEEFVGDWVSIPDDCRTRLGVANHRLGATELPSLWDPEEDDPGLLRSSEEDLRLVETSECVLGDRVFDRAQKFRIRVGPIPLERFESFLPGRRSHGLLVDWVRQYVGDALSWDLQLVLERTPPLALGGEGQLGFTTWLSSEYGAAAATELEDLVLEPMPVRP